MHVIFANTGVQYVCEPLRGGGRFTPATVGLGWQACEIQEGETKRRLHFVQWRIASEKLFVAIDTTCGDPERGFFCSSDALAGDFPLSITGLLDLNGKPLVGVPPIDIVIRPPSGGAESAKSVHLVVDFGNSRTGALLIEPRQKGETPDMEPFELVNRYQLNSWNENGEFVKRHSQRWFSSRSNWCMAPLQRPPRLEIKVYAGSPPKKGGFFGGGKASEEQTLFVTPRLFQDLSAVRLGLEAEDVAQAVREEGDLLLGVSSPKRYLWAADETWLDGDVWHMADPDDRCNTHQYVSALQGPLIRYLSEEDPDELLLPSPDETEIREEELAREAPLKPRHAPRLMMVAALYELLCQAYSYVNSATYRSLLGDPQHHREIRSLSLSYPSGMIQEERERFAIQARKAVELFSATLGRSQAHQPVSTLSIDEASAVHLTYIWSELQMVNRDARLWFQYVGRDRSSANLDATNSQQVVHQKELHHGVGQPPSATEPTATTSSNLSAVTTGNRPRPVPRPPASSRKNEPPRSDGREVRIACIDIGGGTSDLMIARYTHSGGAVDRIDGEVLHRDGISLAGDQLVKRLLECIIVPHFADRLGMGADEVARLFGPELPTNRAFRSQRISWVNRFFVPLAQQYLQHAVNNDDTAISHYDESAQEPVVPIEVVDALQNSLNSIYQAGMFNVRQPLDLYFEPDLFEEVVHEVFDELLFDFCDRITRHDVDIVLLAGQPTKLQYLQERVRMYLPLAASRVIPMHNYYAGTWYPYQDEQGGQLGVISDPKSAVVVGAAIQSLIHGGMLGSITFRMTDATHSGQAGAGATTNQNRYYWGLMTEGTSRIRDDRVLFRPDDTISRFELPVVAERVLIGRRTNPNPHAEVSPVWLLKVDKGNRHGAIDLKVTVERLRPTATHEETLRVIGVKGTIAGEDAIFDAPGANVFFQWRTLANERYYLDTGALDNIKGISN